jgi:large subunit ribosomal protein L15
MDLSNLKAPEPNKKKARRRGRGLGSGNGRHCGRGRKGQKSRSGYTVKPYFEGGQMPLQRRLPKFGFNNPFRTEYVALNILVVDAFIEKGKLDTTITLDDLKEAGVISNGEKVKLLGEGELSQKIDIEVHAASQSARKKVEDSGGTLTLVD